MPDTTPALKSGFTLAELSVVLVIIAAVVGMTMTSGVTVISAARYSATASKIEALNQALMAYRIANDRIPCPSDLSQKQGSTTYGTEGNCGAIASGVFVAQNAGGTATAAEGGVPTAVLGLPSDFMYDGWGNRFRYAVDTKMATINAFSLMQAGCVNGAITVYGGPNYPATGNAARTTGAVYALISHGANGHGGVTKNAVVTNAGSLNSDEQTNCHCTSTGAAGTYAPTYIQLAPYTYQAIAQANSNYNFDDIVSYRERWQMQTNWDRVGTNCAGGSFSRAITIDYTKVSTVNHTNLTNFPMLFSGTYNWLATTGNGGYVTNANGYDITFTSDAAGVSLLPFERESYATNGAVNFWVQLPTVSASANTTIYIWYDNPNITTDQSNKNGTWDSNYVGVWHLTESGNGTVGEYKDSTSNTNNGQGGGGTASKVPSKVAGIFANAQSFVHASNQYISVPNSVSNNLTTTSITLESWIKPTDLSGLYCFLGKDGYDLGYRGCNNDWSAGDGLFQLGNPAGGGTPSNLISASAMLTSGAWNHFVQAWDGTTMRQYINGTVNATTLARSVAISASPGYALLLGMGQPDTYGYNGVLQEIRISNSARSADWIVTEYNNQNSPPNTFYTVGSAVSR